MEENIEDSNEKEIKIKTEKENQNETEIKEEQQNKNEAEIKTEKQNKNDIEMKFEKEPQTIEEKQIQDLQKKLDEQKTTISENEDRIKRLMAEFENFKKRSNKERASLYSSVMGDVITSLLPAIDNLEKAAETETKDEQYKNGVKMCLDQIHEVLKSNGVIAIETVGKKFDPSLHEAVSLVTDPNLGEKIIKQEYRKGYTLGDRVLRHSLVVVAN